MKTELYELLFKDGIISNSPLFMTQKEVVKKIVEDPSNKYENEKSITGYLNQVFLGSRKCGKNLTKAIINAALNKCSNTKLLQTDLEKYLINTIEKDNEIVRLEMKKGFRGNEMVTEESYSTSIKTLIDAQKKAESIFVINKNLCALLLSTRA